MLAKRLGAAGLIANDRNRKRNIRMHSQPSNEPLNSAWLPVEVNVSGSKIRRQIIYFSC